MRTGLCGSGFGRFFFGTNHSDLIYGTSRPDWLWGGAGDDTIFGLGGNDTIFGGAGNDHIDAGTGNDVARGGAGNDFLNGGIGKDTLYGDAGDDYLFGGGNLASEPAGFSEGGDLMVGGAGNDTLDGRNSARFGETDPDVDTMYGGSGNDLYYVDNPNDVLSDTSGIDTVVARNLDWTLGPGFENLILLTAEVEFGLGTGNALNNVLDGRDAWHVRLEGLGGNDLLLGSVVSDTLLGGAGNDTLDGGQGHDILDGGSGRDVLTGGLDDGDRFYFTQAPGFRNADRITDFESAPPTTGDELVFENAVFTALGSAGDWAADDPRFYAAAGATSGHDPSDRLVYDTSTGNLYYDPDGSGCAAGQIVATLDHAPTLAASDIVVI